VAPMISEEKQSRIDGLRGLADWLESSPTVPVPNYGPERFVVPLHTNQAVEAFAAEHGMTVEYDDEGNARVTVAFGPVQYEAYGYVDFLQHCERSAERNARSWAERKGLELRPAEQVSA
jgi:hypothetical protein